MLNFKYSIAEITSKLQDYKTGIGFYFLIGVIVYLNTQGASFADDSIESFIDFKRHGWDGFEHSYDFSSLYYFHDIVSIILYSIFGTSNVAWYLFLLALHSTSSYFIFRLIWNMLSFSNQKNGGEVAFFSSMIFLCGAYNCENVFWIATFHYAFSFLYLTWGLFYISQHQGNLRFRENVILFTPFPFMLTMHEMSFFFPFAFVLGIAFFQKSLSISKWILFLLPYGMIASIVLIATKIIKGSFIPHYGTEHIQNHSIYTFGYTLYQYVMKHLFFMHNFSFSWREKFYDIQEKTMLIAFLIWIVCFIGFVILKRINWRDHKAKIWLAGWLILFFIPVSNMYFMWHFPLQNDRLGYFLSPFLYGLFSLILYRWSSKWGHILVMLFIVGNVFFLRKNISSIQQSIYFTEHVLKESYRPYVNKKPYILNLPFSRNGFYVYRKPHRLKSAMYFYTSKDIEFEYIASMPFFKDSDSISIQKISDSSFRMKIEGGESWFMKEIVGASDYENNSLNFDVDEWNSSAIVTIKNRDFARPILYITGKRGFVNWNQ